MNHKLVWAIPAIAAAGIAAFALWPGAEAQTAGSILPYDRPDIVAQGKDIYAEWCAACHGENLEGADNWREPDADGLLPAPPHDETGHTWHHPDTQLFLITKYGTEALVGGTYRSNMAGFGEQLSDDEILAVLAYIKSTWPPRVIEMHNRVNENAGQ